MFGMVKAGDQMESQSSLVEDLQVLDLGGVDAADSLDEAVDEHFRARALFTVEIHEVNNGGEIESSHASNSLSFKRVNGLRVLSNVKRYQGVL